MPPALDAPVFVHDFRPGAIHYGRGCVSDLDEALERRGLERAVVVCGRNVGANRGVMDPVEAGLGDRLAATFDGTTPEKRIETAYDALEVAREVEADALVPVGSGSSLDVAKVTSVLYGEPRSIDDAAEEVDEHRYLSLPDDPDDLLPTFPVPTTFAGADLSTVAGITVPTTDGDRTSTGVGGQALMPEALFYDPDIFETTPPGVLAGSAFNGFDKAVEMCYSRHTNPVTDATAMRSLSYLADALPRLLEQDGDLADDPSAMDRAVIGVVLAQYGLAARGAPKTSVVHAFGHGLRRAWGVQQGIAHAVMVTHVLRLIFEAVDGRRDLLAEGLGVADADDRAEAVVRVVEEIRDALELPTRLRDVDGTDEAGIPEAARLTHEDAYLHRGPSGFEPTVEEVESAIRAAW
jgi:alcohol dehydrogenase class IV